MEKWIRNYRQEEIEIASSLAEEAKKKYKNALTPSLLVSNLYQDKLPKGNIRHAYRETGPLHIPVLLHSLTVTELFPIKNKTQNESLLGVSIEDIKWLIDAGLLMVSIQDPKQYENLHYLHSILQDKRYRPPSYEIRDRVFYITISNGMYEEYLEEAAHHPVLSQPIWPVEFQEPYERIAGLTPDRIVTKNIQRYAALCSLLGPDLMRDLVDVDPENEEQRREAMRRFFMLHKLVIHPITQGLYGMPHQYFRDYAPKDRELLQQYSAQVETVLINQLGIPIPKYVTRQQILKSHEVGLAKAFEEMQDSIIRKIIGGELTLSERRNTEFELENFVATIDAQVNTIFTRTTKAVKMGLKIATYLGAGAIATNEPIVGAILGALGEVTDELLAEPIAQAVYNVFCDDPILLHYWKLQKTTERLKKTIFLNKD